MEESNRGHVPAYGDDAWTAEACEMLRELFECSCDVFFTFNGTAANALALACLCQSYHSVIAHQHAHIETDECGAPEFFSNGTKLLLVPGDRGKVSLAAVEELVLRRNDIHFPKPRVLSVTQATEMGTVYRTDELAAACELAHKLGLKVHMDGARLANSVATLETAPKNLTWKAGVDVLCFGGTKNGLAVGECIVFFRPELAEEFAHRCKQAGQLAAKMRFLAAPWIGLIRSGAWLANARRANRAARLLAADLAGIDGIQIMYPVEANAAFVSFPPPVRDGLRERGWRFYDFIGAGGSRLMCSWDTTDDDVHALVDDVRMLVTRRDS
jgi:threonine aldolase